MLKWWRQHTMWWSCVCCITLNKYRKLIKQHKMIDEATHSGTWDWNVKWDNIKPWLYIPWSVNVYFFSTSQKERKKKRDKLVFKSLITLKGVHYSRKKKLKYWMLNKIHPMQMEKRPKLESHRNMWSNDPLEWRKWAMGSLHLNKFYKF